MGLFNPKIVWITVMKTIPHMIRTHSHLDTPIVVTVDEQKNPTNQTT